MAKWRCFDPISKTRHLSRRRAALARNATNCSPHLSNCLVATLFAPSASKTQRNVLSVAQRCNWTTMVVCVMRVLSHWSPCSMVLCCLVRLAIASGVALSTCCRLTSTRPANIVQCSVSLSNVAPCWFDVSCTCMRSCAPIAPWAPRRTSVASTPLSAPLSRPPPVPICRPGVVSSTLTLPMTPCRTSTCPLRLPPPLLLLLRRSRRPRHFCRIAPHRYRRRNAPCLASRSRPRTRPHRHRLVRSRRLSVRRFRRAPRHALRRSARQFVACLARRPSHL